MRGPCFRSLADPETLHMPTTIIGVWHAAIFQPAAGWRWWRRLDVARTAVIGDSAADDATEKTGCNAAGNDGARVVMAMPAWRVSIWRRRRAAAFVAIRPIVILRGSRLNAGEQSASRQHSSKDRKHNFLHGRNLQVNWHRSLPVNAGSICHRSSEHAMNAEAHRKTSTDADKTCPVNSFEAAYRSLAH